MTNRTIPALNQALIYTRKFHAFSVSDTAEKTGLEIGEINQIERGNQQATYSHAEAYAKAFNLAKADIVALEEAVDNKETASWGIRAILRVIEYVSKDEDGDDYTNSTHHHR